MTAKLLPVFLECFNDPYVSVRSEVCIACSNLQIRDHQVLSRLVYAATYDPIWKVKALAIQGEFQALLKFVKLGCLILLKCKSQQLMHWDTFKQDDYSTVGDGRCRVGEVWAGTTSTMPDYKGFKLH